MRVCGFGVYFVLFGIYAILFNSANTLFVIEGNKKLLNIDMDFSYYKSMGTIGGWCAIFLGFCFLCGIIDTSNWGLEFGEKQRTIDNYVHSGMFLLAAVWILVTRKKYTSVALEHRDDFLGIKLQEKGYLVISLILALCAIVMSGLAIAGVIQLYP